MKKMKYAILIVIIAAGIVARPAKSYALNMDIGVILSYQGWVPIFSSIMDGSARMFPAYAKSFEYKPTLKLGLNIWAGLGKGWGMRWNFQAVVLWSELKYTSFSWNSNIWGRFLLFDYFEWGESKAMSFDMALDFDKKVHRSIKFVFGIRFNDAGSESVSYQTPSEGYMLAYTMDEYNIWYLGLALGIDVHHHMGKNFYLDAVFTPVALYSEYKMKKKTTDSIFTFSMPFEYWVRSVAVGIDTRTGFSYFIRKARLMFSILFQYKMLPHIVIEDRVKVPDLAYRSGWINGKIDHKYGLLFYLTFKFGK